MGMQKQVSLTIDLDNETSDSKHSSVIKSLIVLKRDTYDKTLATLEALSLYTKKDNVLKDPLHWTTLHELHNVGCPIRDMSRMQFHLSLAECLAKELGIQKLKLFDAATVRVDGGL